jgi:hypothetical protein
MIMNVSGSALGRPMTPPESSAVGRGSLWVVGSAHVPLLPSVRGDLLSKLGRFREARTESERAAALTRNDREKDLLPSRAKACEAEGPKALSP